MIYLVLSPYRKHLALHVFIDMDAVNENFFSAEEIRQYLREFFRFLFSKEGLKLRMADIEQCPWCQKTEAMNPRLWAAAFDFLGQVYGVNATYCSAPFEDHITYFTPSSMRLADGGIVYRLRGCTVMIAISGLAKSPLLDI